MPKINPSHLIKAITLESGMGEYLYEIEQIKYDNGVVVNINNSKNKTDILLSFEHLENIAPNLKYISITVCWFANSLNAGVARIVPKVENKNKPLNWQVGNYTRKTAEEVLRFKDGELTYGGTPTDKSIIELCDFLKKKSYKIMLTPLIMVDDKSLQKPWHGYIKPGNHNSIIEELNHFFKGESGYNKFILHYASLEYNGKKLKDLIESFVIGHELKGLTSAKVTNSSDKNHITFPGVNHLKYLAAEVKKIVHKDVKLTYSANWGDEYHHMEGGFYGLDLLWSDQNIDAVGINAYFPLTDLQQEQINFEKIVKGFFTGEGWDYWKFGNNKIEFEDQTWAWKNFANWWDSKHYNPGGIPTEWEPRLKPIWFTEYGFASIDGTTNAPNKEAGNNQAISNNTAQALAIAATEYFLDKLNQLPDIKGIIPKHYLKGWDARPYPFFPEQCHIWSDCNKWELSHSVNGKIDNIMIETKAVGEVEIENQNSEL